MEHASATEFIQQKPMSFDVYFGWNGSRRARHESFLARDWQSTEATGCHRLVLNNFFFLPVSSFLFTWSSFRFSFLRLLRSIDALF